MLSDGITKINDKNCVREEFPSNVSRDAKALEAGQMQIMLAIPTKARIIQLTNLLALENISAKAFLIPADFAARQIQAKAKPAAKAMPYALIAHKSTRLKASFQVSEGLESDCFQ